MCECRFFFLALVALSGDWLRRSRVSGQRFKCRSGGVTFKALTGTPLARLRHRDKWIAQARAMDEGLRVRQAAARTEVHRTTAFRCRHRFQSLPRKAKAAERGLSAEQVPILVPRNRAGQTTDHVLEAANKRCVAEVVQPDFADDAVLCTDGSGMLSKVTSELGIEHHAVNRWRGEHTRGAWQIQNENDSCCHFYRRRPRRFASVARMGR